MSIEKQQSLEHKLKYLVKIPRDEFIRYNSDFSCIMHELYDRYGLLIWAVEGLSRRPSEQYICMWLSSGMIKNVM